MPESDSMTLSRMFCEKFQSTPGSFRAELGIHVLDQFRLGARALAAEERPPGRSAA